MEDQESCPRADCRDEVDLDWGAARKFGDADRRPRMPASAAEMCDENFRGTVHDLRLLHESGRRGDI
ncbi:hypothetical protein SHY80_11085, partial [Streptococcus suis]